MARLTDKVENALNETRILVLGIQILIGFGFRSFFEPGFAQMSHAGQQAQLAALALILLGLGLLIVPIPFQRIATGGRNTTELHRLATATASTALLPFAVSIALSFLLAVRWMTDTRTAAISARSSSRRDNFLLVWSGTRGAPAQTRQAASPRHI
jgi:hypothetical protein